MWYQQAPAGNRVRLSADADYKATLNQIFSPFEVSWYDSGTSALASAVQACVLSSGKKKPEVIMPAYGCPALVSAVLYAGAIPVLIDLEKHSTWMDLTHLERAINEHTVAVIAVDLFGIQERGELIRTLIAPQEIFLIEDSAQYFPKQCGSYAWFGDYIVLSFGRGKPVSILNGGAVLSRGRLEESQSLFVEGALSRVQYRLKVRTYNRLISPYLYWIPDALPLLQLGSTKFAALESIEPLPGEQLQYLPVNIHEYAQSSNEWVQKYEHIFSQADDYQLMHIERSGELSRFPVLLPTKKRRDEAYEWLHRRGVGVSCMYYCALPEVSAIPSEVRSQGPFPVASEFAARILTLPLHSRIAPRDIEAVSALVD